MNDQIDPEDAARALSEIGRRREQVIRRRAIPGWYWWANAVLMIALTAAVESRSGVILGIGITLFVAGSLVIHRPVSRAARSAPLRRGLVGPGSVRRSLVGLATLLVVLAGVSLATLLSLKAAGVPYPATIAVAVTAVVYAVGWQMLMRYETAILVRRSRSQG
ncbi:hypothetical protein [Actinocrispum wychmicini]|uniref:Uncharacterized protein n=1 Tax=Actinocrispum wychmicini TaxID=1213861 RepID=A0A4R2JDG4_9PSEU|nr:hypothetical protein [Actinocrispum wychmicini]TCO52315.1 hypothetical protein EV192_11246 [Actinocrispum wychmicini]